ncbi:MAG: hypothetical protein JSU63_11545 [Phycisphaerales bacterium]|nr:MAG: hypothetical protein JSU63_11545 [Phycisphaerales bacterium]
MYTQHNCQAGSTGTPSPADHDSPDFTPSIDNREVFRRLIADELRNGRLTPARRRRIVRYAAGMGLSATEAGRMVTACREEVLKSANPVERNHALRLVEPNPVRIPNSARLSLVLAAAILIEWLLVRWLW